MTAFAAPRPLGEQVADGDGAGAAPPLGDLAELGLDGGQGGPGERDDSDLPEDRFLDREESWLMFNQRVLELADDPETPLLERARFLAIFASNLDEFFMVRVAGLKRRIATGLAVRAASGLHPREVMDQISDTAHALAARHSDTFGAQVRPALAEAGIEIVRWEELDDDEQEALHAIFAEQVFPVLTPLAVDPAHPFPYISGLSLNLAVVLRDGSTGHEHFARVKVPPALARFVPTRTSAHAARFVAIEDVIAAHLPDLFPGMQILGHHAFRVTRNEDLEVEEDEAENLLQALERELVRRRFGPPVRLEVEDSIDPTVLALLIRELGITPGEVYALPAPLDLTGLHDLADLDRPELKYEPFVPRTQAALHDLEPGSGEFFAAIRQRPILLHHPYDSFATSVQAFVEHAAADPDVLAIKQTLYRTSGDSPIVDALIDAAHSGKQVLVVVEIKARFDEKANIRWARKLEQAGCHVVYGLVGLKTHAKLSLVVRREGEDLRRYLHIGTGNYNPKTARQYEDLGLLISDPVVGEDVNRLFNPLSGYAPNTSYQRLAVAPKALRTTLVRLIEGEVEHRRAGRPARIRIKANSIVDEQVIDALYRASKAGVPVDLVMRGICAIRPGVPGLSETIRVRSILGRFLEHSRVFSFAGGGEPVCFLGSADLMHRNLDRRVEALVRLTDRGHISELEDLLDLAMADGTRSWHLGQDGTWVLHSVSEDGVPLLDLQEHLVATHAKRSPRSLHR
ncbi:MAG: RNA degradosome polyphosphate kinase [Actinomycetes bacterium]